MPMSDEEFLNSLDEILDRLAESSPELFNLTEEQIRNLREGLTLGGEEPEE